VKKYIASLAILMALSIPTQACSICGPVERALKFMKNWIESSHCLTMRARIAQLRGGTIPPCDHTPKHDNAGTTDK
jgi:hypothetical protein